MRKIGLLFAVFILICIMSTVGFCTASLNRTKQVETVEKNKINLVWQPVVSEENDLSQIEKLPGVNVVSPSWFVIDNENGHIKDNSDYLYGQYVKRKGYKIWALITNDFDAQKTNLWLNDKQAR